MAPSHYPSGTAFPSDESALLESSPTPQLQPSEPVGPKQTVLILEDEPIELRLLSQHLQSLGLEIITASTVAEAERQFQTQVIQLAIFDVKLPDGSGLELCERIDDDPTHSGIPIIVLSGSRLADIVKQTRASGGCFFISKPYDPNVLMTIIERALGTNFE